MVQKIAFSFHLSAHGSSRAASSAGLSSIRSGSFVGSMFGLLSGDGEAGEREEEGEGACQDAGNLRREAPYAHLDVGSCGGLAGAVTCAWAGRAVALGMAARA